MYHPIVSKAKRRGCYSVYPHAGTDNGKTWFYDYAFDDPEREMLSSSCVAYFPLNYINSTTTSMPNWGKGANGTAPGTLSDVSETSTETSPTCGPDKFNKDPVLKMGTILGDKTSMRSDSLPGSALNPVGLTGLPFGMGIWYRVEDYTDTGDWGGTLMHVKHDTSGSGSNDLDVEFILGDNYAPRVEISDGTGTVTLMAQCGASVTGSSEYETHYYNNEWHYLAMTIDDSGRGKMYFNGRLCDSTTIAGGFDFPTVPNIYLNVNRSDSDSTSGFDTIYAKSAAVWDRLVAPEEISRHYHAMFRGSDFELDDFPIHLFKDSDLQPLRRGDNVYMQRVSMTSSSGYGTGQGPCRQKPGGNGLGAGANNDDFYNHYAKTCGELILADEAPGPDSDQPGVGVGWMMFAQWTGPNGAYTPTTWFWWDYTGSHWPNTKCQYASELVDQVNTGPHGWRLHREDKEILWTGYSTDETGVTSHFEKSSGATFLEQGTTHTDYGPFDCASVGAWAGTGPSPTPEVVFRWGGVGTNGDHIHSTSPTRVSQSLTSDGNGDIVAVPTYAHNEDNESQNIRGIGPPSAGVNVYERSFMGPWIMFPKLLDDENHNEIRRVMLHQVPMRTRRPTRALTRQTALMAPMRVLE